MYKLKFIVLLSFISTLLFGQKSISIEGSLGGGLRMLEYSTYNNPMLGSLDDNFFFNEVLLSVNFYSKNDLNRLSFSIGHSLQYLTIRRELTTGEYKDNSLFYFTSIGMGYRRYFSKDTKSRFYCEGRLSVGYPYGLTMNSETTVDGVVVDNESVPFESHPAFSHFLTLHFKADLGIGYSFILNSPKSINRNILIFNTFFGAFHSNTFFRQGQMLGGTFNVGIEYRFRRR